MFIETSYDIYRMNSPMVTVYVDTLLEEFDNYFKHEWRNVFNKFKSD